MSRSDREGVRRKGEGPPSLMILVQLAWVFVVVNADCSIIKYTPHVAKSLP